MQEQMETALRQRIMDDFKLMMRGDYKQFQTILKNEFCMTSEKELATMNKDQLVELYKKTNRLLGSNRYEF